MDKGTQNKPKRSGGGCFLAGLGLLFGLAGTAGAAYLYYSLVWLNPDADMPGRMAELGAEQSQLRANLERFAGEQRAALEVLRAEQHRSQRAAEDALAQMADRLTAPEPISKNEWRLAEVEYLLRVANHQVLTERDTKTALGLLQSADGILAGLDDHALRWVRGALAEEILSLEQTAAVDISGIYLRLDAVKHQLSALTLAMPEYTPSVESATPATPNPEQANGAPETPAGDEPTPAMGNQEQATTTPETLAPPEPDAPSQAVVAEAATQDESRMVGTDTASEEPGFLNALVTEIGRLVRFRRIDTRFVPPPAPDEAAYLELNLRLMLEQAQLAALRHNQAVYRSSLDMALEWANTYLDKQNPKALETIGTLAALRSLNLETPTPDISGSLNELLRVRRANR